MPTRFQIHGLDYAEFEPLFDLDDSELARRKPRRVIATESPGYPCRVSLQDAAVGEELLLLHYIHQPAASPWRASGPIYVRREAKSPRLLPGEVPDYVARRIISVRAYDEQHALVDATIAQGSAVADAITRAFADPGVAYLHLHNAKHGCFSCAVLRMETDS